MNKLLLLLFIPIVCFGQEDIERYKVYNTKYSNIFLQLDSATGEIWQLQIDIVDVDIKKSKSILSDFKLANTTDYYTQQHNQAMKYWEENYNNKPNSIVNASEKEYYKPLPLEEFLSTSKIQQNGRFKLYPTDNYFKFLMLDVISGDTYKVEWNIDRKKKIPVKF